MVISFKGGYILIYIQYSFFSLFLSLVLLFFINRVRY